MGIVSDQEYQGSRKGAPDWWRESVRNSVSVHLDKIRVSAIQGEEPKGAEELLEAKC